MTVRLLVGTSGWQYRDWQGRFYPADLPAGRWLEYYASRFATVELNASFYRLPPPEAFARWAARLPEDFVMAVKASRFLTHIRRLAEPQGPVERLLESAGRLGGKLGPVLLQLSPQMEVAVDRLDATLGCFPPSVAVAVELRHPSWFVPAVREVLERRGAALCLADRGSRPVSPLWRTTTWTYLRFHEGTSSRPPCYDDDALEEWVERLGDLVAGDEVAYAYFNNDTRCCAVRDALRFAALARAAGFDVVRADGGELPAV